MNPISIICPNCNEPVSVDKALHHQLEEEFKKKFDSEQTKKLEDQKRKLREEMLEWKKKQEAEAVKLKEELKEQIKAESSREAELLKEELKQKEVELKSIRDEELKLLQETKRLKEDQEKWEYEKEKQLFEEREKIKKETVEQILEKQRFEKDEQDKQIRDLRRQLEEAHLKANSVSQQLQGEVLELELEEQLKRIFPVDDVIPVGKGVRGADVKQIVRDQTGTECGVIIWESKRTKNWDKEWVDKLKGDMRSCNADIAILVTMTMPTDIKSFSFKDGVYVTNFECFKNVAMLLRMHLIKNYSTKMMAVGKNDRVESLYRYITSNEFAQKIEAMMETYNTMRKTLDKERDAMTRIWAQREKEIERLKTSTLMIHGSLSGLTGDMSEVKSLDFPSDDIPQAGLFVEQPLLEN